jgi:hypothetical protein
VAGGTHLGVLARETVGIEPGAVWIEAAATLGGMAGEAISFRVATYAGLEALTRGLAVAGEEELLTVVKPWAERALGYQS